MLGQGRGKRTTATGSETPRFARPPMGVQPARWKAVLTARLRRHRWHTRRTMCERLASSIKCFSRGQVGGWECQIKPNQEAEAAEAD